MRWSPAGFSALSIFRFRTRARDPCARRAFKSCVTTTRLVPSSRFSSSSSAKTCSALRPSRLPVGSSASTRRGAVTSARATAARWRSPPESWCGRWRESRTQPHALEQRHRLLRGIRCVHAPHEQRHCDILECAELGQQVVELVHETDRAVAQRSRARFPRARAGRGHRFRRGPHPGDRVHRGSAAASSCRNRRRR